MKELLASRIGKEIDLSFGAGTVTGNVVKVEDDILHLEKDGQNFFVRIEKIVAIWDAKEKSDKKTKAPGFVNHQSE